jgi:hypothetical protein
MNAKERLENLVKCAQTNMGINTNDVSAVYVSERVAEGMAIYTMRHAEIMKQNKMSISVDLYNLKNINKVRMDLSAPRAPVEQCKVMLAPYQVDSLPYVALVCDPQLIPEFESHKWTAVNFGIFTEVVPPGIFDGSAERTVIATDSRIQPSGGAQSSTHVHTPAERLNPLTGYWKKIKDELTIVQDVIYLVEEGVGHLKPAIDWELTVPPYSSTDTSNYTNLLKYYIGIKLKMREDGLAASAKWHVRGFQSELTLKADLGKETREKETTKLTWKQYALHLKNTLN